MEKINNYELTHDDLEKILSLEKKKSSCDVFYRRRAIINQGFTAINENSKKKKVNYNHDYQWYFTGGKA